MNLTADQSKPQPSEIHTASESLHYPVHPEEVRLNDRIHARVKPRDGDVEYVSCEVWRLSPLCVELVKPDSLTLDKSDPIDLELTVGGERSYFQGLVVDVVCQVDSRTTIGIRLAKRTSNAQEVDRRGQKRWLCSDEFFPTCVAPSPVRINDYMYFRVRDISASGLQLTCSLRNKFLLQGSILNLACSFPMIGETVLKTRVARVGISSDGGRDILVVGTEFVGLSDQSRSVISQYLMQFSNVDSARELRTAGLQPPAISKAVNFSLLKSEEDYKEVLELRLLAHQHDGTIKKPDPLPEDMGDLNDAKAKILIGKYHGRIVVTGRVRFNSIDSPLEHEAHVSLPPDFPRRDQVLEVSRVCTHPDFRSGDLLAHFLHFLVASSLSEDRYWYLIGSFPGMVSFYKKIGFTSTGLKHSEDLWKEEQELLITSGHDAMLGRGTHPFYWNIIWKKVSDFTIESGVVKPTPMDRVRLGVWRCLSPLATFAFRIHRKRARAPKL